MRTMAELPNAFIFMKVGNHAGEDFEAIMARKREELRRTGRSFWGYGGSACHPLTQVQPFARLQVKQYGSIYLLMEPVDSKADPDLVPATEYSEDGVTWKPIPDGITVTGSRYAIILDEIKPGELELPLDEFVVGIGPNRGKSGADYLRGRVDKACLVRSGAPGLAVDVPKKGIKFAARLRDPFGVILR